MSMVIPMMIPLADALAPVGNSPFSSIAAPFVVHLFYYIAFLASSASFMGDAGCLSHARGRTLMFLDGQFVAIPGFSQLTLVIAALSKLVSLMLCAASERIYQPVSFDALLGKALMGSEFGDAFYTSTLGGTKVGEGEGPGGGLVLCFMVFFVSCSFGVGELEGRLGVGSGAKGLFCKVSFVVCGCFELLC